MAQVGRLLSELRSLVRADLCSPLDSSGREKGSTRGRRLLVADEIKILWMKVRSLRRIQLAALLIWCAAFLGGPLWWGFQVAGRNELKALYFAASGGDLSSVQRLSEHNSSGAQAWLERLAQNRNVVADSRVAAISALGKRHSIDSETLAPLLWIEQPFVVRHATAGVFEQRGYDDVCVSATLYALHAMWAGQTTFEMLLSTERPDLTPEMNETVLRLRTQSEQDFLKLLNQDACRTRNTLKTDYPSDAAFVESVQTKIGPC
jgi:hypothetical protein